MRTYIRLSHLKQLIIRSVSGINKNNYFQTEENFIGFYYNNNTREKFTTARKCNGMLRLLFMVSIPAYFFIKS